MTNWIMNERKMQRFTAAVNVCSINNFPLLQPSEHRRQRSNLHHLLPPVQGDAAGQAAEPRRGDQDSAVDLHQILPGEVLRHKIKSVWKINNNQVKKNMLGKF